MSTCHCVGKWVPLSHHLQSPTRLTEPSQPAKGRCIFWSWMVKKRKKKSLQGRSFTVLQSLHFWSDGMLSILKPGPKDHCNKNITPKMLILSYKLVLISCGPRTAPSFSVAAAGVTWIPRHTGSRQAAQRQHKGSKYGSTSDYRSSMQTATPQRQLSLREFGIRLQEALQSIFESVCPALHHWHFTLQNCAVSTTRD